MPSRIISQAAFDTAVMSNMVDLELNADEALEETINQFKLQGVDLSNIVTELPTSSMTNGEPELRLVELSIQHLSKNLQCDIPDWSVITGNLMVIQSECNTDIAHRVLATNSGAYPILISCIRKSHSLKEINVLSLAQAVLKSFLNGNPDSFETDGAKLIISILVEFADNWNLVAGGLDVIGVCLIKSEHNRQLMMELGIVPTVITFLNRIKKEGIQDQELLRRIIPSCCSVLKSLVLDDDIRVPFGKAQDTTKVIVAELGALGMLVSLLSDHYTIDTVCCDLIQTLGRLSIRNEYCQEIKDQNGLEYLFVAMQHHINNPAVIRQSLWLIKALAGNDDVKKAIGDKGGISVILMSITQHSPSNAALCESGFAAISALTLRSTANANALMENDGTRIIVNAMESHKTNVRVQNSGCTAIRNTVSRSPEIIPLFIESGAEAVIREGWSIHGKLMEDAAKAALRDLLCEVQLQELWTGEKGNAVQ